MKDRSAPRLRLPPLRLTLLAIVVLTGLALFFWLAPRTPVVVSEPTMEVVP